MKRALGRLLAILLGLSLALVAGELLARASGRRVPVAPERAISLTESIDDVPRLGYALRPNRVEEQVYPATAGQEERRVTYTINAERMRGVPVARERVGGRGRIVCVGDSFTFGTGVADGETWPAQLEHDLRTFRGLDVEVLNGGVMGYDARQQVAWLSGRLLEFEPRIVLLCTYLNDLAPPRKQDRPENHPYLARMLRFGLTAEAPEPGAARTRAEGILGAVRRSSRLVDLCAHRLHAVWNQRYTEGRLARSFEPEGAAWKEYRSLLEVARARCERAGAELRLVLYPMPVDLVAHPFREVHARVGELAAELGLPFLDLYPAVHGNGIDRSIVHPRDAHPDAPAHFRVAVAVARWLEPDLQPYRRPEGGTEPELGR